MIPFNIPCSVGNEPEWVQAAIQNGHISGNGPFTKQVQQWFAARYGFENTFLTHSCTGALEMAAMLCDFAPGDEVILPSFTHVGTANAFERAGATLIFADSQQDHPNVSVESVRAQLTKRTRAIVVVHYAGVGCDMQAFVQMATDHGLLLIEDAAHAIGAKREGQWLGKFGHFAAFSFHETKNITCGQGGMLVVNDKNYAPKAAVLWENGTNRAAFFRGEVGQYTWVGQGSCFTLSDMNAAYLFAQLQQIDTILERRMALWKTYDQVLKPIAQEKGFQTPNIPENCQANGHIYYLRLPNKATRDHLITHLRQAGILAVFHYIPLHSSPYTQTKGPTVHLPECDAWSDTIIRLPLYDSLPQETQTQVIKAILA